MLFDYGQLFPKVPRVSGTYHFVQGYQQSHPLQFWGFQYRIDRGINPYHCLYNLKDQIPKKKGNGHGTGQNDQFQHSRNLDKNSIFCCIQQSTELLQFYRHYTKTRNTLNEIPFQSLRILKYSGKFEFYFSDRSIFEKVKYKPQTLVVRFYQKTFTIYFCFL